MTTTASSIIQILTAKQYKALNDYRVCKCKRDNAIGNRKMRSYNQEWHRNNYLMICAEKEITRLQNLITRLNCTSYSTYINTKPTKLLTPANYEPVCLRDNQFGKRSIAANAA